MNLTEMIECPLPYGKDVLNPLKYWVQGVLLTGIGSVGFCLNLLSIFLLIKKDIRRESFNKILLGLQISDWLFVLSAIFLWGLPALETSTASTFLTNGTVCPSHEPDPNCKKSRGESRSNPITFIMFYPIAYASHTCSVYFTILVAAERYLAMRHPHKARTFCTRKASFIAIAIIVAFSVLFNAPRAFENSLEYSVSKGKYQTTKTWLLSRTFYTKFFKAGVHTTLIFIVPFVLLAYFNATIYISLKDLMRKRTERQKILVSVTNMTQAKETISQTQSLALLLLSIVCAFFICNIPAVVFLFIIYVLDNYCLARYFYPFRHFFAVINSSVNFIFYVVFGKQFRTSFLKILNWIFRKDCSVVSVVSMTGTSRETNLETTANN